MVGGALAASRVGEHGHHDPTMSMSLLPMWLRIGWAVALGAVVLVHLWHVRSRPGQARCWHAGHTVMALGMMAMYLLAHDAHAGLYRAGVTLFGGWAVALAVTAFVVLLREGVLNRLWVAAAADMLAMAYMLLPTHAAGVSLVLVVYLFCQTLAWALGMWTRPAVRPSVHGSSAGTPEPTAGRSTAAAAPAAGSPAGGLIVHDGVAIRISLAVMAAGMAYMIAAM